MKTTIKQFQEFKNEVLRLQPILGLQDWQIYFKHGKTEDTFATTHYDREGAVANMNFGIELKDDHKESLDIKRTAKHELLHLLLADLYCIAESRVFDRFLLNQAEEKAIRKLEKFINL